MLSSDDKRRHRVRIPFYLPAVTLTLPKYTPENWIEYRAEVMAACKAAHPDLIRMIGGTLEKPLDTAPTASDWQSVYRWKCGVESLPMGEMQEYVGIQGIIIRHFGEALWDEETIAPLPDGAHNPRRAHPPYERQPPPAQRKLFDGDAAEETQSGESKSGKSVESDPKSGADAEGKLQKRGEHVNTISGVTPAVTRNANIPGWATAEFLRKQPLGADLKPSNETATAATSTTCTDTFGNTTTYNGCWGCRLTRHRLG